MEKVTGFSIKWSKKQVILLLIGGDKSTQEKDIEKAWKIWGNYQKK